MVVGITEQERSASHALHAKLSASRAGRRWERIFRSHEDEVAWLLVVHPEFRRHVAAALDCLLDSDEGPLEPAFVVLDDLARLGGFELRRDAAGLREELEHRETFAELLAS